MAPGGHVVMFPFMGQGHFIPFLRLAKLLAAQGLTVSFVTTPLNAARLESQIHIDALGSVTGPAIRFIPISLPPIDGVPPGCESTDALSPTEVQLLICSCHKMSAAFEQWLESASEKPLCIISDVFLYWTANSASKLGIPRVVFHTTGALGTSLLQYLFTNTASENLSDCNIIEIRDRGFSFDVRRCEIPDEILRSNGCLSTHPEFAVLRKAYAAVKDCSAAALVNTLEAVEAGYVRYLEESTAKPVWAVAPPLQGLSHNESECIRWLDTRMPQSVLYVAFGSKGFLSEAQIKSIAKGIEASNQAFIWTIKDRAGSNVNSCNLLPEGFVEATRDRGMVIQGWVPQLLILSHPSTACFMSHCGWNSTLESICAGVPMVVWPMAFDQFANAKLAVEQLRIGLKVCEGADTIPSSDIVETTVKAAIEEEVGKEMQERAQKIKESINEASCQVNIEAFVSYVQKLRRDENPSN